jgi:hypothetical protein
MDDKPLLYDQSMINNLDDIVLSDGVLSKIMHL